MGKNIDCLGLAKERLTDIHVAMLREAVENVSDSKTGRPIRDSLNELVAPQPGDDESEALWRCLNKLLREDLVGLGPRTMDFNARSGKLS